MLIRKAIILLSILTLICCKSGNNQEGKLKEPSTVPANHDNKPISFVNDYTDLLSEEKTVELDKFLREYEKQTTRECILVVMKDIEPYEDILEFGKDIGNRLGVGKLDKNNGLMMILDMSKRDIGISTGLGTAKVLTDSICQVVINEVIIPKFKDGEFYDGIFDGFSTLMEKWK